MGSDKRLREGDRVTIHWEDAWSSESYHYKGDKADHKLMLGAVHMRSHGEVFAVDGNSVCLAHEVQYDKQERSRRIQNIPRRYITKIEKLVVEK
ncbi:hypothetical protein LCGC14_2040960 [marine sediment metagenome]|uniref:Uncharacterized protein n=1 Tax=marine sediment metagenome TaxID=412755 RepID=A0A0F9ES62_9ZZZZ